MNNSIGLANELAFVMGLDPLAASANDLPVAERDPDSNRYTFTYFRNLAAIGVTTQILVSYDLVLWQVAIPVEVNVLWSDGSGQQLVEAVFEDPSPLMFFRLDTVPY